MMAIPIKDYSIIHISLVAAVIYKYQLFDYLGTLKCLRGTKIWYKYIKRKNKKLKTVFPSSNSSYRKCCHK